MKKIYSTIIVTLILIIGGFGFCFGEDNSDYDETKSSINSYIDDQLEKINLEEIQGYIDESLTLEKVSIKSFIKSASFKSIIVLLCTLLVSGIFLTFANALLKVSDQEKFDRAISKIYGGPVETEAVTYDPKIATLETANILEAYTVKSDGNYIIKVEGTGGFSGGSVTCWVVVNVANKAVTNVGNVVIDSNVNQSYIGRISNDYLASFNGNYVANKPFSTENGYVVAGASYTSGAICNAVNGATTFVNTVLGGGVVEETTPYDEFEYTQYINKKDTTHSFGDGVMTYNIVTKSNQNAMKFTLTVSVGTDKTISSIAITKNGSTEGFDAYMKADLIDSLIGKTADEIKTMIGTLLNDEGKYNSGAENGSGTLNTGATQSNFLVAYSALFATANYDKALAGAYAYTQYIDAATTYTVEGDQITYNVVTKKNGEADKFTLNITVGADKTVAAMTITTNGSTYGFDAQMKAGLVDSLTGKTAEEIASVVSPYLNDKGKFKLASGDLTTGATYSNFLVAYVALYATANYDLILVVGGAN